MLLPTAQVPLLLRCSVFFFDAKLAEKKALAESSIPFGRVRVSRFPTAQCPLQCSKWRVGPTTWWCNIQLRSIGAAPTIRSFRRDEMSKLKGPAGNICRLPVIGPLSLWASQTHHSLKHQNIWCHYDAVLRWVQSSALCTPHLRILQKPWLGGLLILDLFLLCFTRTKTSSASWSSHFQGRQAADSLDKWHLNLHLPVGRPFAGYLQNEKVDTAEEPQLRLVDVSMICRDGRRWAEGQHPHWNPKLFELPPRNLSPLSWPRMAKVKGFVHEVLLGRFEMKAWTARPC